MVHAKELYQQPLSQLQSICGIFSIKQINTIFVGWMPHVNSSESDSYNSQN